MTDRTSRAGAPVSAVCAAFAAQSSAYPPEATKPDVAPVCGSVAETANEEGRHLWAAFGGGEAASGEAGEKAWRFSAPAHPLLPAVRAVLGDKNGAFLRE